MDIGLFKVLVESQEPLTCSYLGEKLGADPDLLGTLATFRSFLHPLTITHFSYVLNLSASDADMLCDFRSNFTTSGLRWVGEADWVAHIQWREDNPRVSGPGSRVWRTSSVSFHYLL